MNIEVIICTYNRPEKALSLVHDLMSCTPPPAGIIVIDSTDETNEKLSQMEGVKYVHSDHKNQPYQRFLGQQVAESEFLLFLDDDMEVVDRFFFSSIQPILDMPDLTGIAVHFRDKHEQTTLAEVPKSRLFKNSYFIRNFKNWFTGYPSLPEGQFGLCGNRGKQPSELKETEYLSGGAFIAKRSALFQNFNLQLLDLFEERLGMGEDAIIGYGLHKRGKLVYYPTLSFLHNDQRDSTYSVDLEAFAKRALYSRLYLSLERQRLNKSSLFIAKVHYQWYSFWRIFGYFVNNKLKPSAARKANLKGALSGWKAAKNFNFAKNMERNEYWTSEKLNNYP